MLLKFTKTLLFLALFCFIANTQSVKTLFNTLQGKTIILDLEDNDTVKQAKDMLAEKLNVPANHIKILAGNKTLENDATIGEPRKASWLLAIKYNKPIS